ncbi:MULTISPECIES: hypothetical protein [Megamonas]|jgi:hypothetical protein|uniref:Uncharacterized protein n=1 Tax=Megamonas rupellensis TaxID=491921 RepID=A0A412CDM4_9FIRM|nr:hypothetical protein [Megamonas rupellensis]RGQ81793.1 hypothetical protein DWY77_07770 [Megamonas rupellensis]
MNKKVFMGITMLNEDNNAIKAIGIIHHLETGKIEKINTENMSNEAVQALINKYIDEMSSIYSTTRKLKQVMFLTKPSNNTLNKK